MTPGSFIAPLVITQVEEIPRGSFVVVRSENADHHLPNVAGIHAEVASAVGHSDFVLVLLRPTESLEVLDTDAMAAAGWHRQPF